MDPNFIPEQTGYPESGAPTEDGASHLVRLKRRVAQGCSAPSEDVAPVHVGGATPASGPKERRRSVRFACSGSVELRADDNRVRMWGTLSDISLHGCYVEMSATLPVDAKVHLVVDAMGLRFHTAAIIRASYPSLGMGMCYAEIEPEQQLQLNLILANLARQRTAIHSLPVDHSPSAPVSLDPCACLEEMAEFFKTNSLLSRDEFYQIAKRAGRP